MSKKLLWLAWKDINHPQSGGAEVVGTQIRQRLAKDGYQVTLLTAKYPNSKDREIVDGVEIIRVGNSKYMHYLSAIKYYQKNLKNKYDFVVEEVNTVPYFINFFKGKEKVFLYYNQLAREIWFHEIFFPLSIIGFLVEPVYTWIQSRFNTHIFTISQSSKKDLVRFGFKPKNFSVVSMAITNESLDKIEGSLPKEKIFTVLFHGSLRAMKRPTDALKAFELFHTKYPDTQMWFSGSGDLRPQMEEYIQNNFGSGDHRVAISRSGEIYELFSENAKTFDGGNSDTSNTKNSPSLKGWQPQVDGVVLDPKTGDTILEIPLLRGADEVGGVDFKPPQTTPITLFGRTTDTHKLELMQKSHVLVATSIKEGWGLIVSEANSMATPSIGYDVDGLRDSVAFGGGLVCEPNVLSLSQKLEEMYLLWKDQPAKYLDSRKKALESSKELTFAKCYQDFKKGLN